MDGSAAGFFPYLQVRNGPDVRKGLGIDGGKTGKVMLPHQIPSGLRHLFHVERGIGKSGVAAVYRRGEGGIVDPVFIGLDGSAAAGMKKAICGISGRIWLYCFLYG